VQHIVCQIKNLKFFTKFINGIKFYSGFSQLLSGQELIIKKIKKLTGFFIIEQAGPDGTSWV